jgi:hypothetical protein
LAGPEDFFYPGHLNFGPNPGKFFVDSEVVRDGRKCLALRTYPRSGGFPLQTSQDEYIIAPALDHSVVARICYRNERPCYSLHIDWGPPGGPILRAPRSWIFTFFLANGEAEASTRVTVLDFQDKAKPGDEDLFDITPPEGAKVGRSHYMVPRGGELQRTEFRYVVKNGKLVQTDGPEMTPDLWVSDNWRTLMRRTLLPASAEIGSRRSGGWIAAAGR